MKPAWLQGLMAESFFAVCGVHENRRKNEKNIFCLNCCQSFCPHCLLSHHPSHPLLQVRRYVYQDVIRLDDLEKLIDCSYIQPYTINSAKVIFLNQRAQSRSCKASGNSCFTCDRILQDPFHFCSLSCKVDHMVYQGEDLSRILYKFDDSDFAISRFEDLRVDVAEDGLDHITPNSILEDPLRGYGGSDYPINNSGSKKKGGFLPGIMLSFSSRRKGAPQRSPLS
ncbi:PLATZ transcription factor family protein [Perilla frutescens var. hirtella]|nr:PLATZ transcription factor family protein [Perilla frutescens var. frutescens]KAH6776231.1 PLATZ transcription factor family protein [Perilla frutescens var. hirtella]